jgi:hypothetical protein
MSNRNNLGDHTFNPMRAERFGLGVASTLAAAVATGFFNMIPGRTFISRRAERRRLERIRNAELAYLEASLAYAGIEVAEARRDAANQRAEYSMARLRAFNVRRCRRGTAAVRPASPT